MAVINFLAVLVVQMAEHFAGKGYTVYPERQFWAIEGACSYDHMHTGIPT